jgi:hypothetical protein
MGINTLEQGFNLYFYNRRPFERNVRLEEYAGPTAFEKIHGLRELDLAFEQKYETYNGMDYFTSTMQDIARIIGSMIGWVNPKENAEQVSLSLYQIAEISSHAAQLPEGAHGVDAIRDDVPPSQSVWHFSSLRQAQRVMEREGAAPEHVTYVVVTKDDAGKLAEAIDHQSYLPTSFPSYTFPYSEDLREDFGDRCSLHYYPSSFEFPDLRPKSETTYENGESDSASDDN